MSTRMPDKKGLLIAAPASGSGKTVITLALLRALKHAGVDIAASKAGPDYIDPGFHKLACGGESVNLDAWAMSPARLQQLANQQNGSHLLVEGMMGLFDGAADGSGSAAELSKLLGMPVLLVVDAGKQSHSVAALVRGFRDHDPEIALAGVILNRVGSPRHARMLTGALSAIGVSVLGAVPRDNALGLPERHLGLVQAEEISKGETFIDNAARIVGQSCDLRLVQEAFATIHNQPGNKAPGLKPLGQHVAIARDEAFSFVYPHWLKDWHDSGVQISFFSPLANEMPDSHADAVFLPGGYPELHVGKLAAAETFRQGMHDARDRGVFIYGECGGYMVLGQGLVDAEGNAHRMTGLLDLETSFARRKLHLGYRQLTANGFRLGKQFSAHEFHYTSALREVGEPLFEACDALGENMQTAGLRSGKVAGSYMHVIDTVNQ